MADLFKEIDMVLDEIAHEVAGNGHLTVLQSSRIKHVIRVNIDRELSEIRAVLDIYARKSSWIDGVLHRYALMPWAPAELVLERLKAFDSGFPRLSLIETDNKLTA